MDNLTYKQLQKIAKEYGIPANIKKDNMLLLIKKAKEEQDSETSTESTEDIEEKENTTEEIMELEEVSEVTTQEEEMSVPVQEEEIQGKDEMFEVEQSVSEDEGQVELEQDILLQNEEEVELENVTEEGVEEVVEGQKSTTTLDNAYTSFANVMHELATEQQASTTGEEMEMEQEQDQAQEQEHEEFESEQEPEEQEQETREDQMMEEVTMTPAVLSTKEIIVQNLSQLDFKDLQKVAKSMGITANIKRSTMTALIVEEQLAHQAQVVVEMTCDSSQNTPPKEEVQIEAEMQDIDELSSKEIDLIFDARDEELDNYEGEYVEEQDYEEEDFSYQKKLFNTPAKNTKTIFTSPSPSKSGPKPYEKFKVTWTYDDFENKDPLQTRNQETPVGTWTVTDTESGSEEDPSSRVGGKMKGMATPKGSKIAFTSPTKSTEKQYYQYNVHWSYDQYLAADEKY